MAGEPTDLAPDDRDDADQGGDGDEVIVTASNRVGRKVPDIVIRGQHEREILALAPSLTCDRVHWTTLEPMDVHALLPDLDMIAYTRQWSDGQLRVWVEEGRGYEARERIKAWCADREIEPVNIRVETAVPFRDLESIPGALVPELVAACVDWLYPRTYAIRQRLVHDLELVDAEDVRSMMYLFVHDHADRYDADRLGRNGTLNFIAFMFGKMRTWPQDAARAAYGRTVVNDRLTLSRVAGDVGAAEGRVPTEVERADALGVSVTELRRREESIATLSGIRNYRSLIDHEGQGPDAGPMQVADTVDVAQDAIEFGRDAALTRALIRAVQSPGGRSRRSSDPLALAAVYLTYWEGLNRSEVARELDVLPKTVLAAVNRAMEQVDPADLA